MIKSSPSAHPRQLFCSLEGSAGSPNTCTNNKSLGHPSSFVNVPHFRRGQEVVGKLRHYCTFTALIAATLMMHAAIWRLYHGHRAHDGPGTSKAPNGKIGPVDTGHRLNQAYILDINKINPVTNKFGPTFPETGAQLQRAQISLLLHQHCSYKLGPVFAEGHNCTGKMHHISKNGCSNCSA